MFKVSKLQLQMSLFAERCGFMLIYAIFQTICTIFMATIVVPMGPTHLVMYVT